MTYGENNFFGNGPKSEQSFRLSGAFHQAIWMAKVIYHLKIYLFRHDFKLTKAEEKGLCDISKLFTLRIHRDVF